MWREVEGWRGRGGKASERINLLRNKFYLLWAEQANGGRLLEFLIELSSMNSNRPGMG